MKGESCHIAHSCQDSTYEAIAIKKVARKKGKLPTEIVNLARCQTKYVVNYLVTFVARDYYIVQEYLSRCSLDTLYHSWGQRDKTTGFEAHMSMVEGNGSRH